MKTIIIWLMCIIMLLPVIYADCTTNVTGCIQMDDGDNWLINNIEAESIPIVDGTPGSSGGWGKTGGSVRYSSDDLLKNGSFGIYLNWSGAEHTFSITSLNETTRWTWEMWINDTISSAAGSWFHISLNDAIDDDVWIGWKQADTSQYFTSSDGGSDYATGISRTPGMHKFTLVVDYEDANVVVFFIDDEEVLGNNHTIGGNDDWENVRYQGSGEKMFIDNVVFCDFYNGTPCEYLYPEAAPPGDTAEPTYSGLSNNASSSKITHVVEWTVIGEDETNLSGYMFETNTTGVWTNDTHVYVDINYTQPNITKTITLPRGHTVCGRFHLNDSSGNWNSTEDSCFTVANTDVSVLHQNAFTDKPQDHQFNVTAGVTDSDNATDISTINISVTSGTCQNLINTTYYQDFNATFNCTGTPLLSVDVVIGFTDGGGTYVSTTASSHSYPNNAPGQVSSWNSPSENIFTNQNQTLNWTDVTDDDSDTLIYTIWLNNANTSTTTWGEYNTTLSGSQNVTYIVGVSDGYSWGTNSTARYFYLDVDIPTSSGLTNNASKPVNDTNINVTVTLADNINVDGFIFYNNHTDANASYVDLSDTTSVLVSGNVTLTGVNLDEYYCGKFYFNDTSNNWGETSLSCWTISTDENPTFNISHNYTALTSGITDYIMWSFEIADDVNLSTYKFGTNITGTWVNDTIVDVHLFSYYAANYSKQIYPSLIKGGKYCGQFWVNDTEDKWTTNESCYEVDEVYLKKDKIVDYVVDWNFNDDYVKNISLMDNKLYIDNIIYYPYDNLYENATEYKIENAAQWSAANALITQDGNYSSCSAASGFGTGIQVTYTKPAGALAANWLIRDDNGSDYLQLSAPCFNYNATHIKLRYYSTGGLNIDYYCYNSSNQQEHLKVTYGTGELCEEGIDFRTAINDVPKVVQVMNASPTSIEVNSSTFKFKLINDNKNDLYDVSNHSFMDYEIGNYSITLGRTYHAYAYNFSQPYELGITRTGTVSQLNNSGEIIDSSFTVNVTTNTNYTKRITCYNNTGGIFRVTNSTWDYDITKNIETITYASALGNYSTISYTYSITAEELYMNFTMECGSSSNISITYDETAPNITVSHPYNRYFTYNKSGMEFNYSIYDTYNDLYRVNVTLYYSSNSSQAKEVKYWDNLNETTLNESVTIDWSDTAYGDYYVTVCAADEIANSPVKSKYTIAASQDTMDFIDKDTNVKVKSTLEMGYWDNGKWKKKSYNKNELNVIAYKTDNDKHIVYGGTYPRDELPREDVHFRYIYHSTNNVPLIIVDEPIGLFHADVGMSNIFWQHKDLIQKGWTISTYKDGKDVIVEFWMDTYPETIDFDPLTGGVNINCLNSSTLTKGYKLNITAKHYISGADISAFNMSMISSTNNWTGSTTNGTVVLETINNSYLLKYNGSGYGNRNATLNITFDYNYTFWLIESGTIYLTFLDETDNSTITVNTTVELISDIYSANYSTTNATLLISGLNASDYTIRASATGYDERFRFYSLEDYDFVADIFYLIPNGTSDLVTVTIYDQLGDPVESAFIKLYRYDLETNSYILVEEGYSNYEGQKRFQMELGSEYYKFLVYYDDVLKKETTPAYFYSTSLSIYIDTVDAVGTMFEETQQVAHALTFQESTYQFRLFYDDAAEQISQMCLNVYRTVAGSKTLYNQSCSASQSSIIYSGVANVSGRNYLAEAEILYKGDNIVITELYYDFDTSSVETFGSNGLLVLLLLTLTLIGMGIMIHPGLAIALAPMPILITSIIGFIKFSPYLAVGLEVVAIIIAAMVSKNR